MGRSSVHLFSFQTCVRLILSKAIGVFVSLPDLAQIQVFTNFRGNFCLCIPQIPFSFLQFPMYEAAKAFWAQEQGRPVSPLQAAACGSVAGAVAAAVTTPLDVIKTRLILEKDMQGRKYHGIVDVFRRVVAEEGPMTLFAGVAPRVMWITIGGFVYFGAYEEVRRLLSPVFPPPHPHFPDASASGKVGIL